MQENASRPIGAGFAGTGTSATIDTLVRIAAATTITAIIITRKDVSRNNGREHATIPAHIYIC